MSFSSIKPIIVAVLLLILVEAALEFRAYKRGFHTVLFGSPVANVQTRAGGGDETAAEREQRKARKVEFPFLSPPVSRIRTADDPMRVWLASASHADDRRFPVETIFPNAACRVVATDGAYCQMLNAAKAGENIDSNLVRFRALAPDWHPDVVVLYQMSVELNRLSNAYFAEKSTGKRDLPEDKNDDDARSSWEDFGGTLERWLEHTTLYSHLRRYVGSTILLQSQLEAELPEEVIRRFERRLESFIDVVREADAQPVLSTFATRYILEQADQVDPDTARWMLRYAIHMSPRGWLRGISQMNAAVLRVATDRGVPVIDFESCAAGNPAYFTDLVHFSRKGHKAMATCMSNALRTLAPTVASHQR